MRKMLFAAMGLLLVLGAGSAIAENITWVTVKNPFQADLAAQVVDHAYTRIDNRFLAGLTAEQETLLRQSGLELETLLTEVDPATVYRVLPDGHGPRRPVDLQSLGQAVALSDRMTLLMITPQIAVSLNEENGYLVTPLSDLSIRWRYLPPAVAGALTEITDFPTDTLIDLISQDSLFEYDTRLMNFRTRYIWSDSIDAARDWMMQKFLSWGYTDVSMQPFFWNSGTHYNVVVVKPGYAEPDKVIVVGGHYDSINSQSSPLTFAPGADDNASGTVATMEIARVLADIPLRKTVIFIPFSAEEVGLVGSAYAAQTFANSGTDVEVMFNFDMIGYDPANARLLALSGASFNNHYRDLTTAAVQRLTDLVPVPEDSPGGSDHQSFLDQGFPVVFAIEGTFNYQGWHTNTDLTSYMNFPYMTKVVQAGLASLLIVANSARPTGIEWLADQGDGQSIEVFWTDCSLDYTYTVRWGTAPGAYTDSAAVPQGDCSYLVSGLQEGQVYYFSATGVTEDSYPSVYSTEDSLTPLIIPRAPTALAAEPDLNAISLSWNRNPEADLSAYRIYRKMDLMDFSLYQDNIDTTVFVDLNVSGQTQYTYRITALDNDGHESVFSTERAMWPATFDGGILIVDEITQGSGVPTQAAQLAFWDTTLGATPFSVEPVEDLASALRRGIAGQYSSLLWFDDDLARKNIKISEDSLNWYAGYPGNLFVCGLRTIQFWGSTGFVPGDIRYDEFGLAGFTDNSTGDFIGAHGQAGWPDLQVDNDNIFNLIPYIPSLQATAGTTIIYTYDASSNNPAREGTPVGLLRQTDQGVRVLLSFPVTFLTNASATDLMNYIKAVFGESGTIAQNGDVDNSGSVNVADLVFLVNFMFKGGIEPPIPNQADPNTDCHINVADLTYLVNFIFRGGPDPQPGCVE